MFAAECTVGFFGFDSFAEFGASVAVASSWVSHLGSGYGDV